jgi:hypothetical protein
MVTVIMAVQVATLRDLRAITRTVAGEQQGSASRYAASVGAKRPREASQRDALGTDGRLVVAYHFSARPTGHTVQLDDGPLLEAMCAIDALGIPIMTGRDAIITLKTTIDGMTEELTALAQEGILPGRRRW